MDTKTWIGSLISAIAGGAAAAVGSVVAIPEMLEDLSIAVKKVGIVAAFAAIANVLAFLKQPPLPGVKPK